MTSQRILVCDLDGVVYRGDRAIPGAGAALERIRSAGWETVFATNNSSRTPEYVTDKLHRIAGFDADPSQVVTSAQVAAGLIEEGPVLVAGEEGLRRAVIDLGFATTEDPGLAATVVAGIDRGLTYERIADAADAVRDGARLIVTNRDPTFPSASGLRPGAGACVAALEAAAGRTGITAGKPTDHMRRHIESVVGHGLIWMVGDRPDTDLALARDPRWRSVLVLTGVTTSPLDVDPTPDLVADDLPAAVETLLSGVVGPAERR